MTMFNRVPGLKPGLRESRRVRSKARSAPAAYEKNFDARPHQILPLLSSRAASCSPPAWPRGAATSRGAVGCRRRATSRPVTYATNYSAETTCGSERRACLPTEDTGNCCMGERTKSAFAANTWGAPAVDLVGARGVTGRHGQQRLLQEGAPRRGLRCG